MWECPSTEALNVAEWIYHNTAFDTVKSLIATHAFSITSNNDPKYFQTKSLLGGLASNIEFNELTHYTQSQARFQKFLKIFDDYKIFSVKHHFLKTLKSILALVSHWVVSKLPKSMNLVTGFHVF